MLSRFGALREKSLYLEFFWSVFSHIRTKYREIRCISLYSVRALENADQKNSNYGNLSHSGGHRSYGSQDINQPYVHSYVNILKKTESSLRSTIMEDFQNQEYRFAILKSRKSCQKKKKTDKWQLQRAIPFYHKVIRMHCF